MGPQRTVCSVLAIAVLLSACSQESPRESAVATRSAGIQTEVDTTAEFVALSSSEGVSGEDWFSLALRAREAGDADTAEKALTNAAADLPPVRIQLERARLAASMGDTRGAVTVLQQLSSGGFAAVSAISGDPVFASLEGNAEFDAVIRDMSARAYPCQQDDAFRAFDFWIGDWDVHQANGQFAGTNRIRAEEAGCVLTEHWTGAVGGTGSSINYLDKVTGEWVQVWNSESGAQISMRGGVTEEGMRLLGTIHYVGNGTTAPFRGLWSPLEDGRIRQFFEQSNDGGETWAHWFEGFYTRQNSTGTQGTP